MSCFLPTYRVLITLCPKLYYFSSFDNIGGVNLGGYQILPADVYRVIVLDYQDQFRWNNWDDRDRVIRGLKIWVMTHYVTSIWHVVSAYRAKYEIKCID
jgi:hypothetical protein